MSDLKYKSEDELRNIVRWCEKKRAEHKAGWEAKEAEIEKLKEDVSNLRRIYGNIGQKEVWARKYLAEKTPAYFHKG